MEDTGGEMLSPVWIFLTVFVLLETLISLILNIGIVLADKNGWRQGQKWNHCNLIHLLIGLVNISLQCSVTGQGVFYVFFLPVFLAREVYSPAILITVGLTYCSYWLSAWLSVYYCTSITSLSHRFLVQLKKTFSTYLPHLLLLSMVASFLMALPTVWTVEVKVIKQSPGNGSHDCAIISATFSFSFIYIQTANFLGCCIPFLLTLTSVVVTVSSLLQHMRRVKKNDSDFGESKFRAHINAIKTMILFLTLFIIVYINVNVFFMVDINTRGPVTVTGWVIFISFPLTESIIIVQASAKLRRFLFGKMMNRCTRQG